MQDRVDLLDTQARELLEAPDAWQALTHWLRLYNLSATEYRGMSARVGDALFNDSSPMAAVCAPMKTSFTRLLARARDEKVVRDNVTDVQILTLISALPKHAEHGEAPTPTSTSCCAGSSRNANRHRRRGTEHHADSDSGAEPCEFCSRSPRSAPPPPAEQTAWLVLGGCQLVRVAR